MLYHGYKISGEMTGIFEINILKYNNVVYGENYYYKSPRTRIVTKSALKYLSNCDTRLSVIISPVIPQLNKRNKRKNKQTEKLIWKTEILMFYYLIYHAFLSHYLYNNLELYNNDEAKITRIFVFCTNFISKGVRKIIEVVNYVSRICDILFWS